jgi:hypothetical protein
MILWLFLIARNWVDFGFYFFDAIRWKATIQRTPGSPVSINHLDAVDHI